jgi:hypothetical protein
MAAPWAVILLVLTVLVGIGGLFYSLGPLDDPLKPQISSEPIAHVSAQEPARPPRATLVAMPRAHETEAPVIGDHYSCHLPDGQLVDTVYQGRVEHFSELPLKPAPGDMHYVDEGKPGYWIWATPLGFKAPAWVDP